MDDGQRLGAGLGDDLLHLRANFGQSVIPADRDEAAVGGALHRLSQPAVGIGPLSRAVTATAERSLGIGVLLHALDGPQPPVESGSDQAALAGAAVAQRCALNLGRARGGGLGLLGPPRGHRASAHSSQRSGGGGTLQEGSPGGIAVH